MAERRAAKAGHFSDYNSDIISGGGVLSGDSRNTSEVNLKMKPKTPSQPQRKKTAESSSGVGPGESASIRIFSGDGVFRADPDNEAHWVMTGNNAEDFTGFQNISS